MGRVAVTSEQALPGRFELTEMGQNMDSVTLRIGAELYRVGNPPATEIEYFGGGFLGTVFEDGSAVIADRKQRRVVLIDVSGTAVQFAPTGQGPGEIGFPNALLENVEGHFAILDDRNRKLVTYALTQGRASLIREMPTTDYHTSACSIDSGYIGMGYSPPDTTIFTVYDFAGEAIGKFGPAVVAGSHLLNLQQTHGPVRCLNDIGRIVATTGSGELISFDMDGTFRWRKRIHGFEPGLTEEREGLITMGLIAKGASRSRLIAGLTVLTTEIGAVQLQEYVRVTSDTAERPSASRVLTMFFELSTGRLVGEQADLPKILHAAGNFLLLAEDREEAWVRVVRFRLARSP